MKHKTKSILIINRTQVTHFQRIIQFQRIECYRSKSNNNNCSQKWKAKTIERNKKENYKLRMHIEQRKSIITIGMGGDVRACSCISFIFAN